MSVRSIGFSAMVLCLLSIFSVTPSIAAERRVALVIGNSAYESAARLENPENDADAVAGALRRAGFEVSLAKNVSREKLVDALRAFAASAEKADWALIFYAGHGIEMSGVNYMLPVDAHLAVDRDLQFEGVPMSQALASVEGARKLRLLILDACRDNPFAAKMVRTAGASRSIGRGLARVEPDSGTLVAYAAKDGQVAQDGDGRNSPFTSALVRHINTPGLELNRLFRRVTGDVLNSTNRRQEPYTYGSLPDEEFFFRPLQTPGAVAVTPPENPSRSQATSAVAPSAEPDFSAAPPASAKKVTTVVPAAVQKRGGRNRPPGLASLRSDPMSNPVRRTAPAQRRSIAKLHRPAPYKGCFSPYDQNKKVVCDKRTMYETGD